ncbi:isoprenyl transferase [Barnesiella sp. WM24]|uniref:isoprenyl transferase n=1 Tax=Barnesiella sp. WM24 TaxID=2558278 RepID=UPI001072C36C|nr:isoprenyl transferase [Barnesiella sp. WM24]MDE6114382.1 isoprenyl transferase [Muribaculum sp.]TFU94831.1 isoprenyl transferase [Barnesiella sp. WM24]
MSLINEIDSDRLPRHIAIIMDGNGRWAKARDLDRSEGHVEGVNTVRRITEIASEVGIGYLTLYTFSTENWNRPQAEVDALMHLIVIAIERETADLIKNNVKLTMIGDFSRMPKFAYDRLCKCMDDTAHCTGLTLILAISYSSRWEITEATRKIARKVAEGSMSIDDITPETISDNLATAGIPDPDLLIRTGGDFRVSNFLLWQIAYSEIYVTSTFWPDFSKDDFCRAILQYQGRERRYGLTSEQINDNQE